MKMSPYFSRINDIIIPLYDYTFFHSASEVHKIDKRFISRERIYDKLKIILKNSETKTGAYLITGHRGVGKTSFVNKVIDDLIHDRVLVNYPTRYFRIFVLMLVYFAITTIPSSIIHISLEILNVIPLILSVILGCILAKYSKGMPIKKYFAVSSFGTQSFQTIAILQDYFLIAIIVLIARIISILTDFIYPVNNIQSFWPYLLRFRA